MTRSYNTRIAILIAHVMHFGGSIFGFLGKLPAATLTCLLPSEDSPMPSAIIHGIVLSDHSTAVAFSIPHVFHFGTWRWNHVSNTHEYDLKWILQSRLNVAPRFLVTPHFDASLFDTALVTLQRYVLRSLTPYDLTSHLPGTPHLIWWHFEMHCKVWLMAGDTKRSKKPEWAALSATFNHQVEIPYSPTCPMDQQND